MPAYLSSWILVPLLSSRKAATIDDSLLETSIAWLWPARFLAGLHQRQHYHEMLHVTKCQFDNEGVPIAPPPQIRRAAHRVPIDLPLQSKFISRGPAFAGDNLTSPDAKNKNEIRWILFLDIANFVTSYYSTLSWISTDVWVSQSHIMKGNANGSH